MNAILESYKNEYGYDHYDLFAKSGEGDIYRFCSEYTYSHPHAKTGLPVLVVVSGDNLRELTPYEVMKVSAQLKRQQV